MRSPSTTSIGRMRPQVTSAVGRSSPRSTTRLDLDRARRVQELAQRDDRRVEVAGAQDDVYRAPRSRPEGRACLPLGQGHAALDDRPPAVGVGERGRQHEAAGAVAQQRAAPGAAQREADRPLARPRRCAA